MITALLSSIGMYTGPPESPFWLTTPFSMVNQPLLTRSIEPQLSPVTTPKWQTGWPATPSPGRLGDQLTAAGQDVVDRDVGGQADRLVVGDHLIGATTAPSGVLSWKTLSPDEVAAVVGDSPSARQWPAE